MPSCEYCGTEYAPKSAAEKFYCRGCEFVSDLISEHGFGQFYDLKQGIAVAPVRSHPFEEHDFSWLTPKISEAEATAKHRPETARLDLALEGISYGLRLARGKAVLPPCRKRPRPAGS